MTAGRGPRHAGRKGGAPVRKSITTRYFYSTAVLLICSIAVMGFIQMYLAMGYFREENGTALIQTIDNAILAMQEAADDGIVEKRAEAAEAAGLDVEDIKRGITLTARAAGKSILVTDAYGSVVLSIVLTNRMTTPLRRISDAAKKFGGGDFSARVPVEGDDELAQLAETFNTMAGSLEKIDQSRRSFMGNIAHELRTPMTTIKGFIDGMLDGTIPPENQNHYLGIVSQEVGRLTRLIKNMLDITKLEAGEYKVNATTYDIWESITSVVFGAEQRLEANNIQISGFAPTKTLVLADQDLVYQVIYNLVDNAIKFCNVGGEIRFSVTQSKGAVTVGVRNTGAGIAPEALPYVFDRFYKEDKSRGLNTTGSGLGLHICKVLINLSGGKIWVDSKEGEYCEFLFTLPAPPSSPIKGGKLKDQ